MARTGPGEIDAVVALMREGRISIGDGSGPIGGLEKAFAEYTGARFALMHNSGTAALHAAYYGVGVGPGDEVLVPTYTWHATAGAVVMANGVPVFCESDPHTLNIDGGTPRGGSRRGPRPLLLSICGAMSSIWMR